jgi:hypothetical protein
MPGTVFNPYASTQPDGAYFANPALGRNGEFGVTELFPKYYELAVRGKVFIGSTGYAGTTPPIYSSTSPTFGLWNTSTNMNAVLLQYRAGFVSGTPAASTLLYMYLNAGYAKGTAAPISAWATATPVSAALGQNTSVMSFSAAGTDTLTTAGSIWCASGIHQDTATAQNGITTTIDLIDGMLIIPPGYAFYTAGAAAFSDVVDQTIVWAEIPV